MLGKTHRLGGICTGVMLSSFYFQDFSKENLMYFGVFMGGCILGSLIPDIDHKGSTISNSNIITKGLSRIVGLFGHRGITHAPLLYLLLTLIPLFCFRDFNSLFQMLGYLGCMGCIIGALSHLFLDFLTKGGIPLFFPFTKKKYHLLPLKTGSCDIFVSIILISITLLFFVKKYFI